MFTNTIILSIYYDFLKIIPNNRSQLSFLHVNDPSIVEVLPIAVLKLVLGMEKFSFPSNVLLLNS